MEVICLEDAAFYKLIDTVTAYIRQTHAVKDEQWISGEEAMKMLRITAKSTLQKFRDEGRIRYSQPEKKIILYDRHSILDYLEKHSKETF